MNETENAQISHQKRRRTEGKAATAESYPCQDPDDSPELLCARTQKRFHTARRVESSYQQQPGEPTHFPAGANTFSQSAASQVFSSPLSV